MLMVRNSQISLLIRRIGFCRQLGVNHMLYQLMNTYVHSFHLCSLLLRLFTYIPSIWSVPLFDNHIATSVGRRRKAALPFIGRRSCI